MFVDGETRVRDLIDSENLASGMLSFSGLMALVSGILLLIWMYKAYVSAESRGATERRWGRGWTIGGWFIPFANLVIPKLVMNEIDRMSNPSAGIPPIGNQWRYLPRLLWSDLWWITLLTGWTVNAFASAVYASAPTYLEDSNGIAYLGQAAGSAVLAIAAAMAGVTVLSIGRRLREPQL